MFKFKVGLVIQSVRRDISIGFDLIVTGLKTTLFTKKLFTAHLAMVYLVNT